MLHFRMGVACGRRAAYPGLPFPSPSDTWQSPEGVSCRAAPDTPVPAAGSAWHGGGRAAAAARLTGSAAAVNAHRRRRRCGRPASRPGAGLSRRQPRQLVRERQQRFASRRGTGGPGLAAGWRGRMALRQACGWRRAEQRRRGGRGRGGSRPLLRRAGCAATTGARGLHGARRQAVELVHARPRERGRCAR